ncbi:Transmembrane protein 53 [Hondaea fermentalgiana]|uniref:Transmembrane protein 53 n=1 Tax=Hondaea fermentalgiana TaxID=2315210 RepID=A0A2R5GLG1_9STRA|nr:Transmembrane protein 53 [Hondaea fermentalgiana]|eukprot:GBG31742.1 Transmembrane protein 53 [Hondaea fermentalgiana]
MSAIVFTLGWWRSKPKALSKYAALYERQAKVKAVCVDTLSSQELMLTSARTKAVQRAVQTLRAQCEAQQKEGGQNGERPRVVVHCMSNNGGLELNDVLKKLEQEADAPWKPDIRGIVFDSCPGNLTFRAWSGALFASSSNKLPLGLGLGAGILATTLGLHATLGGVGTIAVLGAGLVAGRSFENFLTERYHRHMVERTAGIPKLFLYSDGDDLVTYDAVEAVAKRMKDNGDDVSMHRFDGTMHVAHMMAERDKYEKEVSSFLEKILPST